MYKNPNYFYHVFKLLSLSQMVNQILVANWLWWLCSNNFSTYVFDLSQKMHF